MRWCIVAAMLVFLVAVPAGAGGYGSYGYGYRPGYNYTPTYAPTYYTPTYSYPTYSYYPQAYSTYSYVQPSVDYYNGQYHYHASGYDSAGRHYPAGYFAWQNGQWYQNGRPFYETTSKEAKALSQTVPFQPGWQKQLLDIAAARDKVEGRLRTQAADFQQYLQGLQALGLQGNFHIQNYGQSVPYGAPTMPYTPYASSKQYGNQGNTLYGYTYSTIRDIYGDTSTSSLFQQQAKLAENAQSLAGQASTDFGNNVAREGNNRARVAEILAYGQSRKMALDSSHPQIPVEEHREDRIETTGQGQGQVQQQGQGQGQAQSLGPDGGARVTMPRADGAVTWPAVAIERCASCHGNGKHEGGFELAAYEKMPPEQKAKVWARLTTSDPDKRMPRGKDGGPGKPLTPAEFKLFVNH